MPAPKGYANNQKLDRGRASFATISQAGPFKHALDVIDRATVSLAATDAVEASSTASIINATAHVARIGDRIRFTSGSNDGKEAEVEDTATNTITLSLDLDVVPSGGDTFDILRPTSLLVSSSGGLSTAVTFTRDGSSQVVTEDTGTPANNRPLPVKLTDFSGDMILNAANLNLEVQLSHLGANADAVRVGDGVETVNVNASNEMQVVDDSAVALLGTIDADTSNLDVALSTRATEATLSTLNAKFVTGTDIGDVTINNAAGASAVNVQDGGNSLTVDNSNLDAALSTLATQATLSALNAKIQEFDLDSGGGTENAQGVNLRKIASGGSVEFGTSVDPIRIDPTGSTVQPVSAASLPLPSGAATEATLSSIDGKLPATLGQKTKATALGVTLASDEDPINAAQSGTWNINDISGTISLPTGAATESSLSSVDTKLDDLSLDVVDFLDTNEVLDSSSTTIPASASLPLEVVASLAAGVQRIMANDTTGKFIGVFTGVAAAEVLQCIIGPGLDKEIQVSLAASDRVSIRHMQNSTVTVGELAIQFLG